jgi:hypothetical protein
MSDGRTILVAVKAPGSELTTCRIPAEQPELSSTLEKMVGGVTDAVTLRSLSKDNALRLVSMVLDDRGFEKNLTPNFPYPGHPELRVPGIALFLATTEYLDEASGEMASRYVDLDEDDMSIIQELVV